MHIMHPLDCLAMIFEKYAANHIMKYFLTFCCIAYCYYYSTTLNIITKWNS